MKWNIQEERDMFDFITSKYNQRFACVMVDGELVKCTASLHVDESTGEQKKEVSFSNDEYKKEDIALWLPIPKLRMLAPCQSCRYERVCDKDMCISTLGDIIAIRKKADV